MSNEVKKPEETIDVMSITKQVLDELSQELAGLQSQADLLGAKSQGVKLLYERIRQAIAAAAERVGESSNQPSGPQEEKSPEVTPAVSADGSAAQ